MNDDRHIGVTAAATTAAEVATSRHDPHQAQKSQNSKNVRKSFHVSILSLGQAPKQHQAEYKKPPRQKPSQHLADKLGVTYHYVHVLLSTGLRLILKKIGPFHYLVWIFLVPAAVVEQKRSPDIPLSPLQAFVQIFSPAVQPNRWIQKFS